MVGASREEREMEDFWHVPDFFVFDVNDNRVPAGAWHAYYEVECKASSFCMLWHIEDISKVTDRTETKPQGDNICLACEREWARRERMKER